MPATSGSEGETGTWRARVGRTSKESEYRGHDKAERGQAACLPERVVHE